MTGFAPVGDLPVGGFPEAGAAVNISVEAGAANLAGSGVVVEITAHVAAIALAGVLHIVGAAPTASVSGVTEVEAASGAIEIVGSQVTVDADSVVEARAADGAVVIVGSQAHAIGISAVSVVAFDGSAWIVGSQPLVRVTRVTSWAVRDSLVHLWPRRELPFGKVQFDRASRNTAGASDIFGGSQIVASDAGVWRATYSDIIVHQQGTDRILLWNAMGGLLEGRLNSIVMPVHVKGRRPLPDGLTDAMIDASESIPFSDGSRLSDGSGYANVWIDTRLWNGAARRATTLTIQKVACGTIQPGMRFSIGDRLYEVRTVVSQGEVLASVTVRPPLREAVAKGERVNFAFPVCRMRLASDAEMDLTELPADIAAFPTIKLVEAI